MEQVSATRSELLARREELDLARRGRNMLEDKRDQLMAEFRKVADQVLARAEEVDAASARARRELAAAEAAEGAEAVRSAALAGRSEIRIDTRVVSVMGVRIAEIDAPDLGRTPTARGYTLAGSSPRIDDAAAAFEADLQLVLELADRELRLRRLIDEISKTTRRVNALEQVVVPRLQHQIDRIGSTLDERERQDRFRLKRAMERRDLRREQRQDG